MIWIQKFLITQSKQRPSKKYRILDYVHLKKKRDLTMMTAADTSFKKGILKQLVKQDNY